MTDEGQKLDDYEEWICDVLWFLGHHKIGLFGLLETKIKAAKFGTVFAKFGNDWSVTSNHSQHKGGRICVIWRPSVFYVVVEVVDSQFIHLSILHKSSGKQFHYTVIYGFNEASRRDDLWDKLVVLGRGIKGAWIVGGDFNNVLNLDDRIGSSVTLSEVEKFRVVGNDFWINNFQNSKVDFLPEGLMDHCPCVINFLDQVDCADFSRIVRDSWQQPRQGTTMFRVVQKLKDVKKELKVLNYQLFPTVEDDDTKAALGLQEIQIKLNADPQNEALISQEAEARIQFNLAHNKKLKFLRQKAKALWLKEGDMNSAYFHACIRKRRVQNSIFSIQKNSGEVV
ncbi:uncharacterized protein LOC110697911 [Chenopodium quinoa]|uniref:uncharacterized protein LOC110697911 n=1 Tax=Chenopodium quinoa TaxID=63459 RepID=UPI000B78DCBA|nr:uncharacterized protein LOC110697911 [Chenopodium quinoa]